MPIYVYKCEESGNTFEVSQSIKADSLTKCVLAGCSCGGNGEVQRVISKNVGLVFTGSGFYATDYAKKTENNSNSKSPTHASGCSCCSAVSKCPNAEV